VAHKKTVAEMMVSRLTPHWERRAQLSGDPARLDDILDEGARRANVKTQETMDTVRSAMKLR
jgi:tryptophanyl-tRNA synthetase